MILDLARENQELICCELPTFMFDGEIYPKGYSFNAKQVNHQIHPSLYDRVCEVMSLTSKYDLIDKDLVSSFIKDILSSCNCTDDLFELLPDDYKNITSVDSKVFNIGMPLSDDEINQIKERNKSGYHYFARMKIKNLILKH